MASAALPQPNTRAAGLAAHHAGQSTVLLWVYFAPAVSCAVARGSSMRRPKSHCCTGLQLCRGDMQGAYLSRYCKESVTTSMLESFLCWCSTKV